MYPKKKRKRKGKYTKLQELWDNGEMMSEEFYINFVNFAKKFLYKSLILKGYYKDGVRQSNWDDEDMDDCYTFVLGKLLKKYRPERGTLPTYARYWVQGYATTIIQRQVRKFKNLGKICSIDEMNETDDTNIEFKSKFNFNNLEDEIDDKYFNISEITNLEDEKMRITRYNDNKRIN
jgi:hypothetical protein